MRRWIPRVTMLLLAGGAARAQVIPGEIVPPGSTIATTTDADSARLNMGAVPLSSHLSARFTHISELRGRNTALDADALTVTSPLLFDFAGSVGVSWQRPQVAGAAGHLVTGELGLAYAITRRIGVGTRLRISGASTDMGLAPLDSTAALDVGFAWRVYPQLSVGLVGLNLLGPRVAAIGADRAVVAGIGFRPSGTEAFTLGVDASMQQSGTGWVRGGVRIAVPYVGFVRAEAAVDLPAGNWRAGVGLDLVWGSLSAGGGAFMGGSPLGGGTAPLGFYATARYEPSRSAGIPTPGIIVSIPVHGELGPRGLGRMILRLEAMRRDDSVRGVVFAPREDLGGLAHAEELREEFTRLRAAGKYVACHLVDATGSMYYACTAANSITMDASGTLRSAGIRTAAYFLGDALRDIGVHADFVRIGAWKSAPEQFTRRGSTPEAIAQQNQLLDDFWENYVNGVAASRSMTVARATEAIQSGPHIATAARDLGLVDTLGTREVAERAASRAIGVPVVEFSDYAPERSPRWAPGSAVGLLYIDGDMIDGESFEIPYLGMKFVGDRTIIQLINQMVASPRVGVIVLRIDTGGGSAIASEMIWRAVERASRRKPLIVSFGRVAASGGYYIAPPARAIFADPSSLTGSIGIFYGKADIAQLLARVDIGVELSRRGPRADMDSLFRPFSEDERRIAGGMILDFYNQFLRRVAAGRHMTTAEVNAVGEGRVFAGTRARRARLVDTIGGLASALDRARAIGRLPADCDVIELPGPSGSILETLVSLVFADTAQQTPTARLMQRSELTGALQWLTTIAWTARGGAMAMTEWPLLSP